MVYYNEFDLEKAAWLEELIKEKAIANGKVDTRSIKEVQPKDLKGFQQIHLFAGIGIWSYALRLAGWPDDREVWTLSCPCQPFSAAGKRAAKDDERHLWPEAFRLIRQRKPLVCLGEQVSSIDGLAWLDDVQTDLGNAGYTCGAVDLCSPSVGAPNIRQRLYLAAERLANPKYSRFQIGKSKRKGANPTMPLSSAEWLANAKQKQLRATGRSSIDEAAGALQGSNWERERLRVDVGECSGTDGVANASGQGWNERRAGKESRWQIKPERLCDADRLGNSKRPERGQDQWEQERHRQEEERQQSANRTGKPSQANGYWSESDWVLTRPQRVGESPSLRPVMPTPRGLAPSDSSNLGRVRHSGFPLAQGKEARILRLKGYGDSLNAQVCAMFIHSYMDIRG